MMNPVLLALVALPTAGPAGPPAAAVAQDDPPIKVWLSKRTPIERGKRVRVRVKTLDDGYVLVLHADPDGRVRVLFPLDPFVDHFLRGGDDFEIRGRGDREAFQVFESSGTGMVYAAYSRDPFRFDELVLGDHWDYQLDVWRVGDDPEADLTALAARMAAGGRFDYDLVRYDVWDRVAAYRGYGYYPGYNSGLHFRIGFQMGRSYYPFWYRFRVGYFYSRCYDWYYHDPYWYDPYYCDPFYTRLGYDPYFYPYWYDPYWYGPYWGGRYFVGTYYVYSPRYVVTRRPIAFVDRHYRFKQPDLRGDNTTLIGMRRRLPSAGATVRRAVVTSTDRRVLQTRTRAVTDGRRVVTTRDRSADQVRRVLGPTKQTPDDGRRVITRPRADNGDRRIQADGWGITDGRRVITPKTTGMTRPETRVRTQTPRVPDGRRTVQPPTTPRDNPATRVRRPVTRTTREVVRQPVTRGAATVTRSANVQRRPNVSTTPQRSRTPVRRATPSSSTRSRPAVSTPSRTRTVAPSRTPVRRTTPARSVSRPPTRSAVPARRPTTRSAMPSRPTVRRAPVRRPAVRRPPSRRPG